MRCGPGIVLRVRNRCGCAPESARARLHGHATAAARGTLPQVRMRGFRSKWRERARSTECPVTLNVELQLISERWSVYKGSCHCGGVAFDVDGEVQQVVECN